MNDDATLLRLYVEQDSNQAFTELVQRHAALVYSVALRRVGGDKQLAEEVAQTVFTDFARKARRLLDHPAVGSWLYVSANLASAAAVRRERRRKFRENRADFMQSVHPAAESPEPFSESSQLRPLLDDAIVALKADDRVAIVLRFFEKRPLAEVASALRISDEAARKRVDRALEKLRLVLVRRGITSSTAALGFALASTHIVSLPTHVGARLAEQAIAYGGVATGGSAIAVGILKSFAPLAAVVMVGGYLLHDQNTAQRALVAELAGLREAHRSIAMMHAENQNLVRQAATADELRRANEELPRLQAAFAAASNPDPEPNRAIVLLTADGTLQWDGRYVSLREFLARLTALQGQTAGQKSQLIIRANPKAEMNAMSYIIEGARKAGIQRLKVEQNPAANAAARDLARAWF